MCQYRNCWPNPCGIVDLELKVSRAKNEFCLMSGEAEKKKVITKDSVAFIRNVKVNLSVFLAIANTLRITPSSTPFEEQMSKSSASLPVLSAFLKTTYF